MRTIRTIAEMRAWLGNCRAEHRTVGLVPTMGAFHAGHHSLMRAAKDEMDEVILQFAAYYGFAKGYRLNQVIAEQKRRVLSEAVH